MKQVKHIVLGFILCILWFGFSRVNYAQETQSFDSIRLSIQQEVQTSLKSTIFVGTYRLEVDEQSAPLPFIKQDYDIRQVGEGSAEISLRFGKGGIQFPQAGEYRLKFKNVSQSISSSYAYQPSYTIIIEVMDDLSIQNVIVFDNFKQVKTEKLTYKYILTTNQSTIKKLPNTGRPSLNKRFSHLPKTGSQELKVENIMLYLVLCIVCLHVLPRIIFAVLNHRNNTL